MLEWLKKLLNSLGIDIKLPDNISDVIKVVFKIGSDNKVTKVENNITLIQIGEDSEKAKEIIKEVITKQVEADTPLLDSEARKDVEQTSQAVELNQKDQELLDYYKGKLPSRLHELLSLCLILRNMRYKHLDVGGFKLRIMKEYPIYGRNMTNLVNEKYFEYKFKELYTEMEKTEDFRLTDFHDEIDYQIRKLPSMVFVDPKQDYDIILGDARWKLLQMKEHGLEEVTIHAISYSNVETAKKILKELSEEDSLFKDVINRAFITDRNTYFKAVIRK